MPEKPNRSNRYEFSPRENNLLLARFNKGLAKVKASKAPVASYAASILQGLETGQTYPFPLYFERIIGDDRQPFQTMFRFANMGTTETEAITPALITPVDLSMSEYASITIIGRSLAQSLLYMQTFLDKEWSGLFSSIVQRGVESEVAYLRSTQSDFSLPRMSILIPGIMEPTVPNFEPPLFPEDLRIYDVRLPGQAKLAVEQTLQDETFADCTLLQYTQVARALLTV